MGISKFLKSILGEKDNLKNKKVDEILESKVVKDNSNNKDGRVNLNKNKEESLNQLNLRKETFHICLTKKKLDHVVARVAVVMDKSGSMDWLYKNGMVQDTIERLLPVAIKFDDNDELDMWLFNNSYCRLDSISEKDFYDYVNREVLQKHKKWGGTHYAPVIEDVIRKYVKEEPSELPSYVIFITDGENFDRYEAEIAIKEASKYNIFFQFIGIGNERFEFLKRLDEMEGRFIDNANFFQIDNLSSLSDAELYDRLMNEYPLWEKEAKKKGLLK